jgi:hypothetical protein
MHAGYLADKAVHSLRTSAGKAVVESVSLLHMTPHPPGPGSGSPWHDVMWQFTYTAESAAAAALLLVVRGWHNRCSLKTSQDLSIAGKGA